MGIVKGATKEVLSLASWIGSTFLTIMLFPLVKDIAREHISHGLIADIVTACALFVIFLTILSVLNYMCSNFVRGSVLSGVDKFLGALFGIARGAVILSVVNLVANQWLVVETIPEWVSKSKLRPYIIDVGNLIILVLPKTWQESLVSHMNRINKQSILNFITDEVTNVEEEIARTEATFLNNSQGNARGNTGKQLYPEERFGLEDREETDSDESARELATLRPRVSGNNGSDENTGQGSVAKKTEKEKLDMKRFLDQREMFEPDEAEAEAASEEKEAQQQEGGDLPPSISDETSGEPLDSSKLNILSSTGEEETEPKEER
jgi:membrane protein required for colicin V production